ncbi:lathosterol oxidase-like [Palaemon carinicauda]|uniref:lathosterol oxidase-like n=1 Tax=Palaemon carinicauda TaxID=392227 RepID=UPI0035B67410
MAFTTMQGWSDFLERLWNCLPLYLRRIIVSMIVFTMGSTVRGEWFLFWIYYKKAFDNYPVIANSLSRNGSIISPWGNDGAFSLDHIHLQGLGICWMWATTVSFAIYLLSGGFLHWHFYIRQHDRASEWKCQPTKFPSSEMIRQEIQLGSLSLLLASSVTGVIAWYVSIGGKCSLYDRVDDYGWLWFFLSVPIVFVWQDYLTYWAHRMYHHPVLYRHFHKMHHQFKQPTAFSAVAFHPVELFTLQAILFSPMFLFPVHWTIFIASLAYNYYHGIIDHSGVTFEAQWWQPWQPDAIFHDNHHQYTFENFGVNCKYWDKIHGTERKKNKRP